MKACILNSSQFQSASQKIDEMSIQLEFVKRGLLSRNDAKTTQIYFSSHEVMETLARKLLIAEVIADNTNW